MIAEEKEIADFDQGSRRQQTKWARQDFARAEREKNMFKKNYVLIAAFLALMAFVVIGLFLR